MKDDAILSISTLTKALSFVTGFGRASAVLEIGGGIVGKEIAIYSKEELLHALNIVLKSIPSNVKQVIICGEMGVNPFKHIDYDLIQSIYKMIIYTFMPTGEFEKKQTEVLQSRIYVVSNGRKLPEGQSIMKLPYWFQTIITPDSYESLKIKEGNTLLLVYDGQSEEELMLYRHNTSFDKYIIQPKSSSKKDIEEAATIAERMDCELTLFNFYMFE